jgi:CrcB protein
MNNWLSEGFAALLVAGGGAVGAVARYGISRVMTLGMPRSIEEFPWHTAFINMLGSMLLGYLAVTIKQHPQPHGWLLLGTGFCGAFTTFSTFSLETMILIERGRWASAAGYSLGSVLLGVVIVAIMLKVYRS